MGVEREIVKHMRLCASLMSDPEIMREDPGIVAKQFFAAKGSIELLNQFLVPRAEGQGDQCECFAKGWMDSNIISRGIGQLVFKTLKAHMEVVVRGESDFPKIVREDLRPRQKSPTVKENYLVREMKETNCMGSVILLYYYLYWYLLLILLNKRTGSEQSSCYESQLDIVWLIQNLPGEFSFLEFRHLGNFFLNSSVKLIREDWTKIMNGNRATYNFMYGENFNVNAHDEMTRKTSLIAAYRRALATNLGRGSLDEASVDLPESLVDKSSMYIYNHITSQTVAYGMSVMGSMASEFECQSRTQKWEDMENIVRVMGLKNGTSVQLDGKLKDILSKKPYSTDDESWMEKAQCACLFDYCSASLMMDICRSFQRLVEIVSFLLVQESDSLVSEHLTMFLAEMASGNREKNAFISYLRSKAGTLRPDLFTTKDYDFINKIMPTWTDVESIKILNYERQRNSVSLWVDRFKGLYPSKKINLGPEVNHACFLWDFDIVENVDPLLSVQKELTGISIQQQIPPESGSTSPPTTRTVFLQFAGEYSWFILSLFASNSWFVVHGLSTIHSLIDALGQTREFQTSSCKWDFGSQRFDAKNSMYKDNQALHNPSTFAEIVATTSVRDSAKNKALRENDFFQSKGVKEAIKAIVDKEFPKINGTTINLSDISKMAKLRLKTLDDLTQSAKKFSKFPALMWPVLYRENPTKGNVEIFAEVSKRTDLLLGSANTIIATKAKVDSSHRVTQDQHVLQAVEAARASAASAQSAANDVRRIAESLTASSSDSSGGGGGESPPVAAGAGGTG